MFINSIPLASISSAIWNAASRTLTQTIATPTDTLLGPSVPAADAVTNTSERDVLGNKADAPVGTVSATASVVGYTKNIVNNQPALAQTSVFNGGSAAGTVTSGAGVNNYGAYTQLIASTSAKITHLLITGTLNAAQSFTFDIATGAAASEVVRFGGMFLKNNANSFAILLNEISIASGTRIAARCQDTAGSNNMSIQCVGW